MKISELAKKYVDQDPILAEQFKELDLCYLEEIQRHKEVLQHKGINCVVCGRRFLPLPDSYDNCCSVGCRFSD